MVILIGGSSHTGKTMVSIELVRRFGYQCICLDALKNAFVNTQIGAPGTRDDYQMRYWMWPFVAEIARYALKNDRNLILEGCYIPTEWASTFAPDELRRIRCVFLVMSERYLTTHQAEVSGFANVAEKRQTDIIDIPRLISCSQEFKSGCLASGTSFIEIDTHFDPASLQEAVQDIIQSPTPCFCSIIL